MLSPAQLETRIAGYGLEPYITEDELAVAREHDERLLHSLKDQNQAAEQYPTSAGLAFANDELAIRAKEAYNVSELAGLERFLTEKGTLNIPLVRGYSVLVDGETRPVTFVAATEINGDGASHGEMSSMLYLRDHIQAAKALMELYLQDPEAYAAEGALGKELLVSALHLMSTPDQLARGQNVIAKGPQAGQEDWPHISLWFDDLQGKKPNGWRNKQDTLQMLAELGFDAIDRGFVDPGKLLGAHKQFLGSVVPLLTAVGFPTYESSGSWEEVAARRTSVMAVEVALLHKITKIGAADPRMAFLHKEYERYAPGLGVAHGFEAQAAAMFDSGLHEIGRRLPFESPDYTVDSVKHREADVALAYVLMYDVPRLLADANIPIGCEQQQLDARRIENMVLASLESLTDPTTNGLMRYHEDSYQRTNFHTHEVQLIVRAIKRLVKVRATGSEPDLEQKQALRGKLTPQGKEAAWTHPLGQLSAWAAKRSIESYEDGSHDDAARYRSLSANYFNRALSMVTGKAHWTAALDGEGLYQVQHVSAFRLPECMIAYETSDGEQLVVPSPHTPLNWSSAMLKLSVGLLKSATKLEQKR